jgi:CBS domain-containing protein
MTTDVLTASPTTPIRAAIELMLERRIGCLPVVDGDEVVGLLSETDCLRHLAHVLDIAAAKGAMGELPSL